MVVTNSENKKGNPRPPLHGLLFPIRSDMKFRGQSDLFPKLAVFRLRKRRGVIIRFQKWENWCEQLRPLDDYLPLVIPPPPISNIIRKAVKQ